MIDLLAATAATPAGGTTGETPEGGFDAVLAGVLGGGAPAPEPGAAEEPTAGDAATIETLAVLATVAVAGAQIPLPSPLAEPGGDAATSVPAAPGALADTATSLPAGQLAAEAEAPQVRPAKAQGPKAPHTPNPSERALAMAAAHSAVGRLASAQAAQAQAAQAAVVGEAAAVAVGDVPAPPIADGAAALPEALPGAGDPVVPSGADVAPPAPTSAGVTADAPVTAAHAEGAPAEIRTTTAVERPEPRAAIRPASGVHSAIAGGDAAPAAAFPAAVGRPAPQAATEAFTATALHRVLEAAEAARERAPQAMTVEIGGEHPGEEAMRLVVSVRGHTVHVAAHGGGGDGALPPAWGRELAEALQQRGLELGGQGARERQASAREEAAADRPPVGPGRATRRATTYSDDGALRL